MSGIPLYPSSIYSQKYKNIQGNKGGQGANGSQGPKGDQGTKGDQGATGSFGGPVKQDIIPLTDNTISIGTPNLSIKEIDVYNLNIKDTLTVNGNILPTETSTFDIGSREKRFNNIWVNDVRTALSTIYLGDNGCKISADALGLTVALPIGSTVGGVGIGSIKIKGKVLNISGSLK